MSNWRRITASPSIAATPVIRTIVSMIVTPRREVLRLMNGPGFVATSEVVPPTPSLPFQWGGDKREASRPCARRGGNEALPPRGRGLGGGEETHMADSFS